MSEFIENYVDEILAVAEGTEDHDSAEGGAYTAAYGITEVARNRYPKRENESNRDYAVRVAGEYAEQAKQALGEDAWNKMPGYMKIVALDVQYNSSINSNPSFKNDLKEGDYAGALENTLDIISANDPQTGTKGTMPGLAKRRAALYNLAAEELFLPRIAEVNTSPTESGRVITNYLTEGGDSVFKQETSRLHSQASFGSLVPDVFDYDTPGSAVEEEVVETEEPAQAGETYTVQPGDTLYQIAAQRGLNVEDIMRSNSIMDANRIQAGQQLVMPLAESEQEEGGLFDTLEAGYDYAKSQVLDIFK